MYLNYIEGHTRHTYTADSTEDSTDTNISTFTSRTISEILATRLDDSWTSQ